MYLETFQAAEYCMQGDAIDLKHQTEARPGIDSIINGLPVD
jgi:hypothetical protein